MVPFPLGIRDAFARSLPPLILVMALVLLFSVADRLLLSLLAIVSLGLLYF